MMGDSCTICSHWPEPPMQCAFCDGMICESCESKLAACPFCGEYDICPECIEPDDHDCPQNPADIMDADEEEE